MSLISILKSVGTWFDKTFISHAQSADSVAVYITEMVKTVLANPITGFLLNVADGVFHTNLPSDIANTISNVVIPKVLAVELGLQGLPPNPTPAQVLSFEQSIMTAFNVTGDNSKLYTILGAQIYGEIQNTVNSTPGKFADWVVAIEKSYADYQKDLAANATPTANGIVNEPVGTVLPNGNQVLSPNA